MIDLQILLTIMWKTNPISIGTEISVVISGNDFYNALKKGGGLVILELQELVNGVSEMLIKR